MTCPNCNHSMVKMYFRYFDRTPPEWYEWYCNNCSIRLPVSRRNSCRDCAYRSAGCHVRCEDYKAYVELNREKYEQARNHAQMNNYVNDAIRRVKQARNGWDSYRHKESPSK